VFSLLNKYEDLYVNLDMELKQIYYEDAVEEWLQANLTKRLNKLKTIVSDANEQLLMAGFKLNDVTFSK
jgi:hypothetical protein